MNKPVWTTEWPTEEGLYWFYGYRYGRISCGMKCELELQMIRVMKISNGFMFVAEGSFMYESEVEDPHFTKVVLPELPDSQKFLDKIIKAGTEILRNTKKDK